MKKLILLNIVILAFLNLSAQTINCLEQTATFKVHSDYEISEYTKGSRVVTGHDYEHRITLMAGEEYRLSFMASPVLNNRVEFEVTDVNIYEALLELDYVEGDNSNSPFVAKYNSQTGNYEYPYYTFKVATISNIKIKIKVLEAEQKDRIKGCVTVIILKKKQD